MIKNITYYGDAGEYDLEIDDNFSNNNDWNQVKGFRDENPNTMRSLLLAVEKYRKIENRERLEKREKEMEMERELLKQQKNETQDEDEDEVVEEIVTKKAVSVVVVKFDGNFPSLEQAASIRISKNTDISDGWTEIKDKKVDAYADKKNSPAKTKMCESIASGKFCRHGRNCRFAHNVDEIMVSDCVYGKKCNFITCDNGIYCNNGKKVCGRLHPSEKLEDYHIRSGLKTRGPVTEEEMDSCYNEFLSQTAAEVKKPAKFVKYEFKKFENVQFIEKKITIVIASKSAPIDFAKEKIHEKNSITNKIRDLNLSINRNDETISRFKNSRDITEFYKKQISKLEGENKDKSSEIENMEIRLKNIDMEKPKQQAKPEPEPEQKVVVVEVKQAKIVKPEATVTLYVSPKKQIVQPEPQVVLPVLKAVVVVPKVVGKCWNQCSEIQIPINIVEICQVEPVIDDNNWISVKSARKVKSFVSTPSSQNSTYDRNSGFDILKDKTKINSTLTRTKMCSFGTNCRRGSSCRFAHSKSELTVSTCVFGNCCKFVSRNSSGFINISKTKICLHKHPDEHVNNFYQRIGL
jgi:hypothetical protein